MPRSSRSETSRTTAKPAPAPKAAVVAKPVPPPARRFLVRCTFVGEQKKQRLNGSFRFVAEAGDSTTVLPKLEKAVKKLRRTGELPSKCDVFVEFVLELAELDKGIVADFERWEIEPRRFQHGCITFSDACAVYHTDHAAPAFRFGKSDEPGAVAS